MHGFVCEYVYIGIGARPEGLDLLELELQDVGSSL